MAETLPHPKPAFTEVYRPANHRELALIKARLDAAGPFPGVAEACTGPDMGCVVPERANRGSRELLRPSYRIVYRRREDAVEILAMHHSARLFAPDEPGGAG